MRQETLQINTIQVRSTEFKIDWLTDCVNMIARSVVFLGMALLRPRYRELATSWIFWQCLPVGGNGPSVGGENNTWLCVSLQQVANSFSFSMFFMCHAVMHMACSHAVCILGILGPSLIISQIMPSKSCQRGYDATRQGKEIFIVEEYCTRPGFTLDIVPLNFELWNKNPKPLGRFLVRVRRRALLPTTRNAQFSALSLLIDVNCQLWFLLAMPGWTKRLIPSLHLWMTVLMEIKTMTLAYAWRIWRPTCESFLLWVWARVTHLQNVNDWTHTSHTRHLLALQIISNYFSKRKGKDK